MMDSRGDFSDFPTDRYWASVEFEELVGHLNALEKRYMTVITELGLGSAWIESYCAYFGIDPDSFEWESHRIGFDGEEGELLRFRVNELRSYVRQMGSLALGQRPSFECEAANTDYDTITQIETADAAVNQIYWEKYGERKERRTIEKGDLFGLSFTWAYFDPTGGREVDVRLPMPPEMGGEAAGMSPATEKQRTGDIVMRSLAPWETWCDPYQEEQEDHVWRGAKVKRGKWEIVAELRQQGKHAEAERVIEMTSDREDGVEAFFGFRARHVDPDQLIEKYWFHGKTRAMPDGRFVRYVGDVLLYDGPLPGRRLYFESYCPGEFIGTAFGYTEAWDLIPLNQMMDAIVSDVATNLHTFGVQGVVAEAGIDITPEELANGMSLLRIPPGSKPPTGINLAAMPEGAWQMLEFLQSRYQSVSALNSVVRGQPDKNISSGEMAALFHSIAIEANGYRQAAVDDHRERTANMQLELIQDNMQHPLVLELAGNDERQYLSEVDPKMLSGIRRIRVKTANPMLRTTAGRLEVAKMMMQIPGAVTTPQQIDELLVSGQLKPVYKAPRAEMLRIAWENEELAKQPAITVKIDPQLPPDPMTGQPATYQCLEGIPVLATDNPQKHIREHLAGVSSRDAMAKYTQWMQASQQAQMMGGQPPPPDVITATMIHVMEHVRVWRGMDPALAMLLELPPPPSAMGMMGPGQEGPEKPGGGPPEDTPEALDANPSERDTTGTKLPQPSQNPYQDQMQT